MQSHLPNLYIGLMSGTSLDGVDGVLAEFPATEANSAPARTIASAYLPFPSALRDELMGLQAPGDNEIHREALAANALACCYADCIVELLTQTGMTANQIRAIGAHGQTIRHRPELGFTRQTLNPALLAELVGIDVIADFRSRDIAAGGQGAPLVPAFHQAIFGSDTETRVVANIGGIGNISILAPGNDVLGFDTGPGNVLMDFWISRHRGANYDAGGAWAASGTVIEALLDALMEEPYLMLPPPKSTGRDLFHPGWLERKLSSVENAAAQDVQASLCAFTAATLANAIVSHAPRTQAVYVCGGGAHNQHLMRELERMLQQHGTNASVAPTSVLGVAPNHVEALAFAWLAHRHLLRLPANLPLVTGARGLRILGAHYPA